MADALLRMLLDASLGLALVLLLRRPARRLFGAGPAFPLWLLPVALAMAPLLPRSLAPAGVALLPTLTVVPHATLSGGVAGTGVDWALMVIAAWLAGTAFGVARLAWQYFHLRASARRGSAQWLAAVQADAPSLDLRRVRVHPAGPAVLWALPRSLVLLPADFAQRFGYVATRELVLRHELTHARRGDAWWSLAMELACTLLWFHPLAWIARPRFRLDQELACDAAALRATPQHTAGYARALLDSVAAQPVPALIPWLAEPQLKERIAMLTHALPGSLRRRAGYLAVVAVLAGGLLAGGGGATALAASVPAAASRRASISVTFPSSGLPGFARASIPPATPTVDIAFKNRNPPAYPIEALHKGEQGTVILDVNVDAVGHVTHVAVNPKGTTAPAVLQNAAVVAARKWRFNPGIRDGRAVGGTVRIPVWFSLDGWQPVGNGHCPAGFQYRKGSDGSYSCIGKSAEFKKVDGQEMMRAGKPGGQASSPMRVLMSSGTTDHS